MEENIYRTLRNRLIENEVQVYPGSPLVEVKENGIYVDDDGNLLFLPADTVVLAVGSRPRNGMESELKAMVPEFHVIGDCRQPNDALQAIHDGAEAGRRI